MPILQKIAIKTVFGKIGDFLKSIPSGVWVALIALALIVFVDHRAYERGYNDRAADAAEAARKAADRARAADSTARDTITTITTETEQGNEDARTAANGSDDPLRAGFDSLRKTD